MKKRKIVITGAAGFIGGRLALRLDEETGRSPVLVDLFTDIAKKDRVNALGAGEMVERDKFPDWLDEHAEGVDIVFHLGARTDTTEQDAGLLKKLNTDYSKRLWEICTIRQIPLVYASSAATYGMGENGFSDEDALAGQLKPLNAYGVSKQEFDLYVLSQRAAPPFWAGLKFFNVYGPGEGHKGRMASVVFHAFEQIKKTGTMKLFESHRPDYKHGEQLRDFIYVDDITSICCFFYRHRMHSGIYNCGTGRARTFNDLAKAVFDSLSLPPQIEYIPIPEDIRDKYQYYTCATTDKLRAAGYDLPFTELEPGVGKYIRYLESDLIAPGR